MSPAARPSRRGPAGRDRSRPGSPGLPAAGAPVLAAFAALLILAPPASNYFWAVNGLRSLGTSAIAALLLVAALAALPALLRLRGAAVWWGIALVLALAVAFPLRERIHLLGDTQYRLRALQAQSLGLTGAIRLLVSPLDFALDVWGATLVHGLGIRLPVSISILGLALGLAYLGGAWRLSGRLGGASELRIALALALSLTGTLEAFAGYAEVAGLVAAASIWWWAELLAPMRSRGQALRSAAAFAVLLLGHRIALAAILPQLWRALGPPAEGDRPEARRALLGLTLGAIVLAGLAALRAGVFVQLGRDVADLLRSTAGRPLRPSDSANGLLLVAPLALLAPALAGRRVLGEWLRAPAFQWIAIAATPLLVALAWVFPIGETGLGAHRDWDANVLLGITLSAGAVSLLARLPANRLRLALALALPLLAVGALGWVAVNADPVVATARGVALGRAAPLLPGAQMAHLHDYFGQRAMDERRPDLAARHYRAGYEQGGGPRRLLLEAEAWLVSGNPEAARRALALARSRGPLNPELESSARELGRSLGGVGADSAAGGPPGP